MSLINFSFEHLPQYIFLYVALFFIFLLDIQVLPLFLDLNILMVCTLAVICYWAIYHPSLLPVWLLFAAGILKDLLTNMPFVGASSIIFIAVFMVVKQQRVFMSGQSFFMIWAVYMLVSFFACFTFWILLCLYLRQIAPVQDFAIEGCVMILAFPIAFSAMAGIHKLLPFAPPDKASL